VAAAAAAAAAADDDDDDDAMFIIGTAIQLAIRFILSKALAERHL